jgi:circadian clock protein KaiC
MPTTEQHASSGIKGLDQLMKGGFSRRQLALIRGPSGAGKTTLSLQFLMEGIRQGERGLYIGTSETVEEIHRIARSHEWDLRDIKLYHHEAPPAGIQQTMLHPAEVELPETVEGMLSVVKEHDPQRLVIDSLTEIRVLARDEMWYRRQLMSLKQYFADKHCTVLLTEIEHPEHSTLDSIVSTVLELEHDTPGYGPDRRRLRINKMRGQDFTTGFHDYTIRTGGLELFPRLTAAAHRRSFDYEQIGTGTAELDSMIGGGLDRGTSVLLLGPSGTGKSLMVAQFLCAAAERGEPSVFYVFDERIQTLVQRTESIGLPLQQHIEQGTIHVRQIDPAELSVGEFSNAAQRLVEDDNIRLVAIDSLNGYAYAMPNDRSLSVHLHELASYLNQQAVISILTMTQHGLFSEHLVQPFDVSYIADSVILFRHFEFAGRVHKAISVYKRRSGPHETSIREFKIEADGLKISEPLTQFQGILGGLPQFLGDKLDGRSSTKPDQR